VPRTLSPAAPVSEGGAIKEILLVWLLGFVLSAENSFAGSIGYWRGLLRGYCYLLSLIVSAKNSFAGSAGY